MKTSWLHRYCILLAFGTLLMVIVGSLVSPSGMEKAHRMLGMTVGALAIGLVVLLWAWEPRRWLRWLGLAALLLLIGQGMLGAMSVHLGLPPAVRILHALLAQLFFGVTALLVLFTSRQWEQRPLSIQDSGWPTLRQLAALTPLAVLLQAALGASYRHELTGVLPHVLSAMAVALLILMLAVIMLTQHAGSTAVKRPTKTLLILVLHQLPLGVLAYYLRISSYEESWLRLPAAVVAAAHVAVGALLMGWSAASAVQIWKHTRSASS
ncbi:MAG: COX15/CtaA family protein [Bryobacteraceae bacterium]